MFLVIVWMFGELNNNDIAFMYHRLVHCVPVVGMRYTWSWYVVLCGDVYFGESMRSYAFWNNKGGTGKTSLNFQTILAYAKSNPAERVLVLDLCPQANLSELLLGGLVGAGSQKLLQVQGQTPRATVGGYFQMRLPQPYSAPAFRAADYIIQPSAYNTHIESNIRLLAGDPLLELQATAVSTLANTQIPGSNPWLSVIDWLRDFLEPIQAEFDVIFIDCNPSFSIYTQIALSVADFVIIPVMADDSSRRALQNAFSLIYGLHLPSPIYAQHSFSEKLTREGRTLPKVHTVVKNRLTQYMGPASAYSAVLATIDSQVEALLVSNPEYFAFNNVEDGVSEMRDFGTTGVVAFARGMSFIDLTAGRHNISGRRVQVKEEYRINSVTAISQLVARI
ncbi:ParA family protein [Shewanella algae]|uniref:ParA family protein n=1 Tax=Shewanella algae TaxID=38313 RepID=UPI00313C3F01